VAKDQPVLKELTDALLDLFLKIRRHVRDMLSLKLLKSPAEGLREGGFR